MESFPGISRFDGQLHIGGPMCNYSLISYILQYPKNLVNTGFLTFGEKTVNFM